MAPTDPDPDCEASAAELIAAARRFHRRLRRRLIEALDLVDLTFPQFEVLEIIEHDRNHHAGSIAGHLALTRQASYRLAVRMEAAGLIRFLRWDGGVKPIQITDLGRQRLAGARDLLDGFYRLVEDGVPPATRGTLTGL